MANEKRLISYDVLIAHLDSCIAQGKGLFKSVCVAIKCFVEQMPTVVALEVVHGQWVKKTADYVYYYACSECGEPVLKSQWGNDFFSDYCPNCGARMDGDGNG